MIWLMLLLGIVLTFLMICGLTWVICWRLVLYSVGKLLLAFGQFAF